MEDVVSRSRPGSPRSRRNDLRRLHRRVVPVLPGQRAPRLVASRGRRRPEEGRRPQGRLDRQERRHRGGARQAWTRGRPTLYRLPERGGGRRPPRDLDAGPRARDLGRKTMKTILAAMTLFLAAAAHAAPELGKPAPDFTLNDQ